MDVLAIFDEKMVRNQKDNFLLAFQAKCEEERAFCAEQRRRMALGLKAEGLPEPVMTPARYHDVEVLLARCGNAYHVEALQRFVLRDCIIPVWSDVETMANRLMTEQLHA
jgi:hypothetical protein